MKNEQNEYNEQNQPQRKLLHGVTVVDFTHVLSGPYATMILRQLGARVIKLERAGRGDDSRSFGPFKQGKSTYFTAVNWGKESVAVDLESEADRELVHRLLERADVLVENFRPGVLGRFGLDWDSLKQRYPRLIYGSVSGFGQNGPYRDRPAYDVVVQAMSGLMSITGQADGLPTRAGVSIGDITAGLYLAIGVCAALYERAQTGRGRRIDVAMLDCQIAILEDALTAYAATGAVPRPLGSAHPSTAPFGAFRAADGYLVIAAANDALFEKLCHALGRLDLLESDLYRTNALRRTHLRALTDELEATLTRLPASDWLSTLQRAGVPCGLINDMSQVVSDPQLAARNMIVPVDDPVAGQFRVPGNPIKVDGMTEDTVFPPAPELDADRCGILEELFDRNGE